MINQAACPGSRSNPGILDSTLVVGELMSSVGIDSNLHTCRILVATHLFFLESSFLQMCRSYVAVGFSRIHPGFI